MTIRRMVGAGTLALLFTASVAIAQAPAPLRVRATIDSVDGPTLNVTSRDGTKLVVKLADNATITGVVKASLSDVKQGGFVGITAMPLPDGTQKAVEIHIFPEAMRGTGEGHRPWDLMPNSTMTNATVDSEVTISDGQKLVLKYKDGEKTFIVPTNVVVVTYAPATAADLKPGAKVMVPAGAKQPDGTVVAPRINVGLNGLTPPM
jgi:outer membrane lipoprotein SlyB